VSHACFENCCKQYARDRNVHLLYVPPYSPWFNPVEGVFSIVKRNYYSTRDIQQSFQCVKDIHIRSFFHRSLLCTGAPDAMKTI